MKNFLSSSKKPNPTFVIWVFRAKAERLHVFRAVLEQKIKKHMKKEEFYEKKNMESLV